MLDEFVKSMNDDAALSTMLANVVAKHEDPMRVEFFEDICDALIAECEKGNKQATTTGLVIGHEMMHMCADKEFVVDLMRASKSALRRREQIGKARKRASELVDKLDKHFEGHEVLTEPEMVAILVELKKSPEVKFEALDGEFQQEPGWAESMIAKA